MLTTVWWCLLNLIFELFLILKCGDVKPYFAFLTHKLTATLTANSQKSSSLVSSLLSLIIIMSLFYNFLSVA